MACTAAAAATPIARLRINDHRRVLTPATVAASGSNVTKKPSPDEQLHRHDDQRDDRERHNTRGLDCQDVAKQQV